MPAVRVLCLPSLLCIVVSSLPPHPPLSLRLLHIHTPTHTYQQGALSKVLEHLKNIKLESEERVFTLKSQLQARGSELEEAHKRQAQLEDELDFRQSQLEEVRRQQSQKHRLEALDDWKALVQQLQADRKRLSEEVDRLRGERRLLIVELRKDLGEAGGKNGSEESSSNEDDDRQTLRALAVNGGGVIAGEADALLLLEEQGSEEMRRLRKHCERLELENRRSQLEIQRLREQVRRDDGLLQAWGRAAGTLGNYFGLFGGGGVSGVKRMNHPVIQV